MARAHEVLLFQVGARTFAAGVADVVRIGSAHDEAAATLVHLTSLGEAASGGRGIVVREAAGRETTLVVDEVLGFREIGRSGVQPLPALAAAVLQTHAVTGLLLVDGVPTPLIDLSTLIRERRTAAEH